MLCSMCMHRHAYVHVWQEVILLNDKAPLFCFVKKSHENKKKLLFLILCIAKYSFFNMGSIFIGLFAYLFWSKVRWESQVIVGFGLFMGFVNKKHNIIIYKIKKVQCIIRYTLWFHICTELNYLTYELICRVLLILSCWIYGLPLWWASADLKSDCYKARCDLSCWLLGSS